jgi:hypothetical protein
MVKRLVLWLKGLQMLEFNRLQELTNVKWDGVPRLSRWLESQLRPEPLPAHVEAASQPLACEGS